MDILRPYGSPIGAPRVFESITLYGFIILVIHSNVNRNVPSLREWHELYRAREENSTAC